jgi:hypothetical protein
MQQYMQYNQNQLQDLQSQSSQRSIALSLNQQPAM